MERQHYYWGQTWRVIKPVFNKYPRWQSIHRRGQCVRREETGDGGFASVLLTQENVPAIFDNNRTFYTKLIGERNVALEHVTYGTMIRVLPVFPQMVR